MKQSSAMGELEDITENSMIGKNESLMSNTEGASETVIFSGCYEHSDQGETS